MNQTHYLYFIGTKDFKITVTGLIVTKGILIYQLVISPNKKKKIKYELHFFEYIVRNWYVTKE